MSYCVNCGVELDRTCTACPLCQTPVLNPNQPIDRLSPPPFPMEKGVEPAVKRYEFTILMTIMLFTTSVTCFLLNHFVFEKTNWSAYVIGLCAMLWIFLMPVFFPDIVHTCASLILNGISIAAYLAVVSWLHPGNGWYLDIALPLTALATALTFNYYFFCLRRKSSMILKSALFVGSLAVLCVSIELLIHYHNEKTFFLSWSAIVLTCCGVIDIVLITISFLTGLRAELRRRVHF